jgi:CheY-like chemotaxis protein
LARILVVDDEPMVCALVSRALIDDGHVVTAEHDARAALEFARAAVPQFDLIITNTWMPGVSGSELIARLRPDFPTVPILHLDDITRPKSGERPEDATTPYKPFNIGTLREAVRELLVEPTNPPPRVNDQL